MSADTEGETRDRRTWHPIALAVGIGCYVLAVIAGMSLLMDHAGFMLLLLMWIVHLVLLSLLIHKLGAKESSEYPALFIVILSVICAMATDVARDNLTLQVRGERVTATVAKERTTPAAGREGPHSLYTLERQNGTRVRGPEMNLTSDPYDVGQVLTVIEDPEGELAPRTLGDVDATGELIGAGALALAALGSVGWMTWRGSDTAKRRDDRKPSAGMRKVYKTVTRNHTTQDEQEEKLREALRTYPADRRGYIKVHPEDYPDVSQRRAARIAWEAGLRAEAAGNRGSGRFRETVNEEVPHD
ncbi:hypothetical protein [Streptomyces sp. NBC_00286]|uniref:hypothetical protein n=1 Tax=Streptomyces sp. NBC_00286 TaxID=2975701 RepID=UPI002E2C7C68|nr:hypothetical protein [Streptomyces sp. NBC_00286]